MMVVLKDINSDLINKYSIKMLLLFGSVASGKNRPDSDLDLAILTSQGLDHTTQLNLIAELINLYGNKADITFIQEASPLLKYQIAVNSKLLYGTKEDYYNFISMSLRQYWDTAKLRKWTDLYLEKNLKGSAIGHQ